MQFTFVGNVQFQGKSQDSNLKTSSDVLATLRLRYSIIYLIQTDYLYYCLAQ
jgi:hypothetical protein